MPISSRRSPRATSRSYCKPSKPPSRRCAPICGRVTTRTGFFAAEGSERNALVLENTKIVTVWNLIKLSNVETIYEIWKERYDRVIKYLEGVAAGTRTPSLPLLTDEKGEVRIKMRCGSNPKFRHSF